MTYRNSERRLIGCLIYKRHFWKMLKEKKMLRLDLDASRLVASGRLVSRIYTPTGRNASSQSSWSTQGLPLGKKNLKISHSGMGMTG